MKLLVWIRFYGFALNCKLISDKLGGKNEKNHRLFIFKSLFLFSNLLASNDWRVFGPPYIVKSKTSSSPFCKWHKTNITYKIVSAPSGLTTPIHNSFDTWENTGQYNFSSVTSGQDFTIETVTNQSWFGYAPFTSNSQTGEITAGKVQINLGPIDDGTSHTLIWNNGTENVGGTGTWYVDVQNCVTHEIGHNLGIAHHSTGSGEPTMATRAQCSDFNTTLKRRTLETDDELALKFLQLQVPVGGGVYTSIQTAVDDAYQVQGVDVNVNSGTFAGFSMKSGVDVIGAGREVTKTNTSGTVTFNGVSNATLRDIWVQNRINVNGGSNNRIYKVKSSHSNYFGVDVNGGTLDIDRFYSNTSPHCGNAVYMCVILLMWIL